MTLTKANTLKNKLHKLTNEADCKKQQIANLSEKINCIQSKINHQRGEGNDDVERLNNLKEEIRVFQTTIAQKHRDLLEPRQQEIKKKEEELQGLQSELDFLEEELKEQNEIQVQEEKVKKEIEQMQDAFKVASYLKSNEISIKNCVDRYDITAPNDNEQEKIEFLLNVKPRLEREIGQTLDE